MIILNIIGWKRSVAVGDEEFGNSEFLMCRQFGRDSHSRIPNAEFRMPNSEFRIPYPKNPDPIELQTQFQHEDFGHEKMNINPC